MVIISQHMHVKMPCLGCGDGLLGKALTLQVGGTELKNPEHMKEVRYCAPVI